MGISDVQDGIGYPVEDDRRYASTDRARIQDCSGAISGAIVPARSQPDRHPLLRLCLNHAAVRMDDGKHVSANAPLGDRRRSVASDHVAIGRARQSMRATALGAGLRLGRRRRMARVEASVRYPGKDCVVAPAPGGGNVPRSRRGRDVRGLRPPPRGLAATGAGGGGLRLLRRRQGATDAPLR